MQIHESCGIRNFIDVAPLAKVPGERTHITDFEYTLETDLLLDANREVVGGWRLGMNLNGIDRGRSFQPRGYEINNVVNGAEIDLYIAPKRRIADQAAAGRTTAVARLVVNA